MYNDTVTVFNRKGDYWYPTILHNVHMNMDRAAILAKYGENSQDSAMLNIRYRLRENKKMIGEKEWLPPKVWEKMEDPSGYITFQSGNKFDFVYFGEWPDEEPVDNRDHVSFNGFYNYMNSTYDYVFAFSGVGGPYSVIPHFEILCR